MAEALGGELCSSREGTYCLVRTHYDNSYLHGQLRLGAVDRESQLLLSAFTASEAAGTIPPESLLFIDTETTGLGGSGAVAFLVGCGSVVDSGFEIRQYIIPDYSDETAMLESLLDELTDDCSIVSYNGAAFDLPLLRSRCIINRVAREIPHRYHLDLLHPTRRLYRLRLSDCSLTNIERSLLGFERADDIPGYLIPSVYFDWLNQQRLDSMNAVLEHNRFDILSLWFLLHEIHQAFTTEGASLVHQEDIHCMSRLHSRRRKHADALAMHVRIDSLPNSKLTAPMKLFRALEFKRTGAFAQAAQLLEEIVDTNGPVGERACLELAIHLEHRQKLHGKALSYARRAADMAGTSRRKQLLDHRIARLCRKITSQ
ncbi:MAG: ribonuclease H-like domain-containing protein [Candidatus Zixiibacteriota bacterium]